MTQREMYDALQKHARANYTKGWDWIVECVEFGDFQDAIIDFKLDTYAKVLTHYSECVEIRQDRMDDVLSESAW